MTEFLGWVSALAYSGSALLFLDAWITSLSRNIDTKLSSVVPFGLGVFSFLLASVFGAVWLLVK